MSANFKSPSAASRLRVRWSWDMTSPTRSEREAVSGTLLPSLPLVDCLLRDDLIHENIMIRRRNLREHLALERQCHQRRIRPGVLQELVVVALAMAHTRPCAIERHAGD